MPVSILHSMNATYLHLLVIVIPVVVSLLFGFNHRSIVGLDDFPIHRFAFTIHRRRFELDVNCGFVTVRFFFPHVCKVYLSDQQQL